MPFVQIDKVVHFYTVQEADNAPALVLCGDQDLATPPELARELAEAVFDSKFSTVEGAAHISCVEQPELFSRLMINILQEKNIA